MTIKKAVLHYISACVLITVVIGLWNVDRRLAQIIGIAALCDLVITFWKVSRDAKEKKAEALAKMKEQAHRRRKIRENKAHEAFLKEHGFEPVSEEEMKDRLNDIDFMD